MVRGRAGGSFWRRASIAAIILVGLLLAPVSATAAEYTVDSTEDQPDAVPGSDGCKTLSDECTLRAAIEESNASAGINDTIKFSASFDGEAGDTIELATPLPPVVDARLRIEGFPSPLQCETDYFSLPGPCVGIDGPTGGTAFRIEAERVVLIGFAISGAQTAIEAVGAPGLEAWNNWLGVKLNGSAGPNGTGVFVDQNSNGPIIGGSSPVARNLIANSSGQGLDIDGADNAVIRGNGFGVLPDGNSPAPNGKNIEITDAAAGDDRVAQGNWIGGTLTDGQLESPMCDGACNLISGAMESGIDLAGDDSSEEPSSGSTRIFGNHIGLNAFGTSTLPNALHGVLVGSADGVSIGGPRPGDRNMINGTADGVLAGPSANNLTVEGNWIGLDPSGSGVLSPPTSRGIAIEGGRQSEVTANRIAMASGTAIEQGGREAVIRSNVIGEGVNGEDLGGASIGIHLLGSCFICNLLYDNSIANAADHGVLIENDRNRLYGNRIKASGAAGVRIEGPPLHGFSLENEIGGDIASEENTISESGGAAVEIVEAVESGAVRRNKVARNNGSLNGGLFIDLVDGANEGILPPTFLSATRSGAAGDALPGAAVRVFRKAGSSPGEIESFLAEDIADTDGNWVVTYPSSIPGTTMVAASQTDSAGGTSELAFSTTAAAPGSGAGKGDADGGKPPEQAPAAGPALAPFAPIALLRGKVLVKGGRVLVRVICRRGPCGGALKIFARVPVAAGRKARGGGRAARRKVRFALIGKRRLRMPAGARKVLRIPLNRRGRALVRRAGRRDLKVRLGGRGVRSRVARLQRPAARAKRRR